MNCHYCYYNYLMHTCNKHSQTCDNLSISPFGAPLCYFDRGPIKTYAVEVGAYIAPYLYRVGGLYRGSIDLE